MDWKMEMEDLVNGYTASGESCTCILCGKQFEQGRVYEMGGELYDARGAVRYHIRKKHGNTADFLLNPPAALTGVTEIQKQLLQLLSRGMDDESIGRSMGIAQSTVRNHRFKLREKEKQARLFLAMMKSLEKKTQSAVGKSDQGMMEEVHASATMLDDRYSITPQERERTIAAYMDENGALLQFPAREKKKIIVLREIVKNFKADREYSEKEVNRILERIYARDYPTVRRYLIEYGFMDRSKDGSVYRVKE